MKSVWLLIAMLCVGPSIAEAQLFGRPRTLGSPLSRQPKPGQAALQSESGQINTPQTPGSDAWYGSQRPTFE